MESASLPENLTTEIVRFPENLTKDHQYTRDQYVYLAKLAESSERYAHMVQFMVKLVDSVVVPSSELTVTERDLLSVAYKNMIGELRGSWRTVSEIETKEDYRKNEEHVTLAKHYKSKLEVELTKVCFSILKRLDSLLLPTATNSEAKVFFLKMKGDYYRYLAEFKVDDERKDASDQTMASYKAAQEIALTDMPPTHPLRLGVALNLAVFHFEILNMKDKACSIGKQAFDEAFEEIDDVDDEKHRDSLLVMQLIKDNLDIWNDEKLWKTTVADIFGELRPIQRDA